MSIKHPFFGQQHGHHHGHHHGASAQEGPDADSPLQGASAKDQARACGAYAARQPPAAAGAGDGLPPFTPGASGPLGGLFAPQGEDAAVPQSASDAESVAFNASATCAPCNDEELAALCAERVCPACPVKKEADDARLRAMADLENTKKRLIRERDEQVRFAAEGVLSDIVPALDNLDLALMHADKSGPCKNFVVGVEMTRKLLLESLQKYGLVPTGTVGEPFDPARHEAVGMQNDPNVPDGYVSALLSCGYTLKDRLLRPAKVMVCKKG